MHSRFKGTLQVLCRGDPLRPSGSINGTLQIRVETYCKSCWFTHELVDTANVLHCQVQLLTALALMASLRCRRMPPDRRSPDAVRQARDCSPGPRSFARPEIVRQARSRSPGTEPLARHGAARDSVRRLLRRGHLGVREVRRAQVSDRQSAPVIAALRRPAGLDSARRLRDAQTISRSRRHLDR
jgi:hypothetical protein